MAFSTQNKVVGIICLILNCIGGILMPFFNKILFKGVFVPRKGFLLILSMLPKKNAQNCCFFVKRWPRGLPFPNLRHNHTNGFCCSLSVDIFVAQDWILLSHDLFGAQQESKQDNQRIHVDK